MIVLDTNVVSELMRGTTDPRVLRFLNFAWGVRPRLMDGTGGDHIARVEQFVRDCPDLPAGEPVVITAGRPTPGNETPGTNEVKIYYK